MKLANLVSVIVFSGLAALLTLSCGPKPEVPQSSDRKPTNESVEDRWQKTVNDAEGYEKEGKLVPALDSWKQALALAKPFGEKSEKYALTLHALAQLESNLEQYPEAQRHYEELISDKERNFKNEYLGFGWNSVELGDTLYRQQKYAEAVKQYKKANEIFQLSRRYLGGVVALRKLAFTYFKMGDLKAAIKTYYQVLATTVNVRMKPDLTFLRPIVDEEIGQMDADRATIAAAGQGHEMAFKCATEAQNVWGQLIDFINKKGMTAAADGRLSEIVKSLPKGSGPPPTFLSEAAPQVVNLQENLAAFYCRQGRYAESEFLFQRMIEVFDDIALTNANFKPFRQDFVSAVYKVWRNCIDSTPDYLTADSRTAQCGPGGTALDNPYLKEFAAIKHRQDYFEKRLYLPQKYAWAVPDCAALKAIKEHQPIVEAGAGTGYWASLLKKMSVDVVAYDLDPVPSKHNPYHFRASQGWTQVSKGDEHIVKKYPERTLLICWPPEKEPFAFNALSEYKGKTFIYIGEGLGGCNGTPAFFQLLSRNWKQVKVVSIPEWAESHDNLYVYERK